MQLVALCLVLLVSLREEFVAADHCKELLQLLPRLAAVASTVSETIATAVPDILFQLAKHLNAGKLGIPVQQLLDGCKQLRALVDTDALMSMEVLEATTGYLDDHFHLISMSQEVAGLCERLQ